MVIVSAVVCSIVVTLFIFLILDSRTDFLKFSTFLKKEGDINTLEAIGAIFMGEELKYPNRVIPSLMNKRLEYMYKKTGKKEYLDFLNKSNEYTRKSIIFFIIFTLFFCIFLYNLP